MHTAPYFTAFGLLAIFLSLRVVAFRREHRQSMGAGGHEILQRRMRVFGNFTEYVPLGLIFLIALEFVQAPVWYMHLTGGLLLIGRSMHAAGLGKLKDRGLKYRVLGMVLTFMSLLLGTVGVTVFSLLSRV